LGLGLGLDFEKGRKGVLVLGLGLYFEDERGNLISRKLSLFD